MGQFFLHKEKLISALADIQKNKKIVFTNGCFDLLHVGHVRYLQEAKALGDILVVGLNSDVSVKRLKGEARPLQAEADRAEILAALSCVDYVAIFSEDTPENLIKSIKPNILVKGGDWTIEKVAGSEFVMSYGGQVKILQFVRDRSTTLLVEKMKLPN